MDDFSKDIDAIRVRLAKGLVVPPEMLGEPPFLEMGTQLTQQLALHWDWVIPKVVVKKLLVER